MIKKFIVASMTLGTVGLIYPNFAFSDILQKTWLDRLLTLMPVKMCDTVISKEPQLREQLAQKHIDRRQCILRFQQTLAQCIHEYKSNLPLSFNKTSAKKWGNELGNCAATVFYDYYLAPTYTKKSFAQRMLIVPLIPRFCASPDMQNTLAAKKSNAPECIAKLNPYRQACIALALKKRPAKFKGGKIEKAILQDYMNCLITKSNLL